MSWKEIMKVWTDRTTKCSVCGRPHYVANLSLISEEAKKQLKFMPCHLPVHPKDLAHGCRGYVGSYIEKEGDREYTVDAYDYDISMKKAYITISQEAKKEEDSVGKEVREDSESHCSSCGQTISKEEFEGYSGMCSDCYGFWQQELDYEAEEDY